MSFHKEVKQIEAALSSDKIKFHPPTGISVLVVGAGVGGLMSALECRRKGHDVRLIERASALSTAGMSCWLNFTFDYLLICPYQL
jgi:NADPH-dependent 2,4-dienoyl-CoA reductase/sulfur reductase-like enzyme